MSSIRGGVNSDDEDGGRVTAFEKLGSLNKKSKKGTKSARFQEGDGVAAEEIQGEGVTWSVEGGKQRQRVSAQGQKIEDPKPPSKVSFATHLEPRPKSEHESTSSEEEGSDEEEDSAGSEEDEDDDLIRWRVEYYDEKQDQIDHLTTMIDSYWSNMQKQEVLSAASALANEEIEIDMVSEIKRRKRDAGANLKKEV